ncbi:Spo0B domain-containing protein [Solibacillus sp. FSL H8-0538]|uniref:Spo0B domain-containing protein n=1 Tax=Solibacillus sp. FSL H8-0538 TaxID=2921400 RepID=UPI0030F52646
MTERPLTISEVLRFANHDFLNQLHLIQMNLDLQRIDEAKIIIQDISNQCKMLSSLNNLQLPQTVEWIQTFSWRFPAIQMMLTCDISATQDVQLDEVIVQYLENTVIHVYDHLDPYTEQQLQVEIESDAEKFWLTFHLQGKWEAPRFNKEVTNLNVQTYAETNTSWKYILSLELE